MVLPSLSRTLSLADDSTSRIDFLLPSDSATRGELVRRDAVDQLVVQTAIRELSAPDATF